jgi:hypothetical protein
MVAVLLLLFAGGIGLTQAVSDPQQVTLRWLRLGGIVALSLLAVAATTLAFNPIHTVARDVGLVWGWDVPLACAVVFVVQLIAVQRGKRGLQRFVAAVAFLVCAVLASIALTQIAGEAFHRLTIQQHFPDMNLGGGVHVHDSYVQVSFTPLLIPVAATSSGLLGGFLMTMLLGHAYLTAGNEMTQAPFRRLVLLLAGLLIARAALSAAFGLWPYLTSTETLQGGQRMWNTVMLTARYAVGLIVPGVFTYMTHDCVRRRANQSATGILYVATVLVIVGEGIALALLGATGYVF